MTPEQRDSENARRRARREDDRITPLHIQFDSPTTERQCQTVNQRDVPTSSNIRMPMVDITNHQSHVTHDHGRHNLQLLFDINANNNSGIATESNMPTRHFCVGESSTSNVNNTPGAATSGIRIWKVGRRGYHNCARDYQESLYSDQGEDGEHFRLNIRKYNHVFAFTSMGVVIDDELADARQGVYTYRAHGSIYHRIGGLLPLNSNDRPRFLQMYIYDTEHENEHRMAENATLRVDIIDRIKNILNEHNPFVHTLRHLAQRDDIQQCKFVIKEQAPNQHNYSMPSASQVAAVVVGGDDIANLKERDVMVESVAGRLMSIKETAGYYDPLQYPLLFPYGSYGWDLNTRSLTGKKITCREFYSYMFQMRECYDSIVLRAGRLTQQFAVDNCVKMQASNLRWVALNQDTIRADLYKGLEDSYNAGEHNTGMISHNIGNYLL
ncbi:uncharacterized protein LOC104897172 [Beta vulgaris subsp. vulgaris]|uniref:uncharacterized protein LOC104897172 n=1 Tax=Beta vulgaris subsp. vulgaris TaxID=3555 RepID=UPI002549B957|nr:uncharacterized protein LOC104897172 [Beta vulgaris subsp. vulgaris]